ncbi:MAG: type I restriction enzyme HsdR N-terminal domain-containing protein [Muribaculaceae bacterium]|nr:type I restriction enzyme HsdR N-terminal domain-containing protein [Muribaculaceae bacterium]
MDSKNSELPKFPPLNLPRAELKLLTEDDKVKVYDSLRRKYVVLTPEEYVRQHFVNWLVCYLHYPASNIANEMSIRVNDTLKRCDTVIIDRNGSPFFIIEYKAPGVVVNQQTFDQIVRYNMSLKAKYLIVSNGLHHYCCIIDYKTNSYQFIPRVPDYHELKFGNAQN